VAFEKHWKQVLFFILFHNGNPIIDETNKRLFNLGLKVQDNISWDFFGSYFLKNERNPFETPHIYFLMLNGSNDNSNATTKSSSIKLYILDEIPYFFKSLKSW
jgi:hypothetical protein